MIDRNYPPDCDHLERKMRMKALADAQLECLPSIAAYCLWEDVRQDAIEQISDESVLAEIIKATEYFEEQDWAFDRIKDDNLFADIAINGPDRLSYAAMISIKGPDALCTVAIEAKSRHVAYRAYQRLISNTEPENHHRYRIAEMGQYFDICLRAFYKLSYDSDYNHLALHAKNDMIRELAAEKATDPQVLYGFLTRTSDPKYRIRIFERMCEVGRFSEPDDLQQLWELLNHCDEPHFRIRVFGRICEIGRLTDELLEFIDKTLDPLVCNDQECLFKWLLIKALEGKYYSFFSESEREILYSRFSDRKYEEVGDPEYEYVPEDGGIFTLPNPKPLRPMKTEQMQ